jgi:hypothetical protein
MLEFAEGIHLHRSEERAAEIEALAGVAGGRAGLDAVLADLNRQGRRSPAAPGLAVHRALTWDREDRATRRWWPQGISTSADASDTEDVRGRRLLVTTWYAKDLGDGHHGSRVSFVDLATHRYRHVLLVVPRLVDGGLVVEPLRVHAGGIVWHGPWLHVAATARGMLTCHVDDIVRVPDDRAGADRGRLAVDGDRIHTLGYRYLLPVRFAYQARTDEGHERLRYSFVSLDRLSSPPQLVAGEYARGSQTRRLARYPLDPASQLLHGGEDGISRPLGLDNAGLGQAQGAVLAGGRYHVTVSHGPWVPGSVYVGTPGHWVHHRWAVPMGPEDIAYWPSRDELWSLSEHPHRRWIFALRRSRLDD